MTETKEYRTTKESCEQTIALSGCVCHQCGGQLTAIETVDNSNNPTYWSGCEDCSIFAYGVKPIIHAIAKHLVMNENYVHYSHMFKGDYEKQEHKLQYWYDSQIGGACRIVSDVLRVHKELSNSGQEAQECDANGMLKEQNAG